MNIGISGVTNFQIATSSVLSTDQPKRSLCKVDQITGASARINQVSVEQTGGGHVANGQTRPSFARAIWMGAMYQVDVMHGELPWCEFQTDCVFWINSTIIYTLIEHKILSGFLLMYQ